MVIQTKQGSDLNSQGGSSPGALGPTQRDAPSSPHNVTIGSTPSAVCRPMRVCPGQQPGRQDTRAWSLGRPTQPRVPSIACEQHVELSWPQAGRTLPFKLPGHRHLADSCAHFGTFVGRKKLPGAGHMPNPSRWGWPAHHSPGI